MRSEAVLLQSQALLDRPPRSPKSPRRPPLTPSVMSGGMSQKAQAKAEKGWISNVIKPSSHNTLLVKLQKKSAESLKVRLCLCMCMWMWMCNELWFAV